MIANFFKKDKKISWKQEKPFTERVARAHENHQIFKNLKKSKFMQYEFRDDLVVYNNTDLVINHAMKQGFGKFGFYCNAISPFTKLDNIPFCVAENLSMPRNQVKKHYRTLIYQTNFANELNYIDFFQQTLLRRIIKFCDFDLNMTATRIDIMNRSEVQSRRGELVPAPTFMIKNCVSSLEKYFKTKLPDKIFDEFNFDHDILKLTTESIIDSLSPINVLNNDFSVSDNLINDIQENLSTDQFNQMLPILNAKRLGF